MKKLSIATGNLYTHDGSTVVLGGLERYTRDLAFLCRDLGYEVRIHQFGDNYWVKEYEGFPVKAYPFHMGAEYCVEKLMDDDLSQADYVIYMWLGFQTKYKPNSITINHGIWYDDPGQQNGNWGINVCQSHIIPALNQTAALITVDLNFLNYCRAVIPQANNNKMQYIPNYVDTNKFTYEPIPERDYVEILYPRRYDRYRGIYLMQEIVPELLAKYPNIRFNFAIDQNHQNYIVEWNNWLNQQPNKGRIRYRHYQMDEMPEAYHDADIVVIPTICSEGTSLSLLESQACGRATVTTNVGGLSNLVLPEYNGKIVNPTKEDIMRGIEEYIDNPFEREVHAQHAFEVATQAFNKTRWDEQWTKIIKNIFK